jgi:hypothetical protein
MNEDHSPALDSAPRTYLGSERARDQLGAVLTYVGEAGGTVVLTDDGAPDGAIVHHHALAQAGLEVAARWGVRQARAQWGTVRLRAATDGPQGLTYRGSLAGVLVDHPTFTALSRGLPVLLFEELELDSTGLTIADGHR